MKKTWYYFFLVFILITLTLSIFTANARQSEIQFIDDSGITLYQQEYFTGLPENTSAGQVLERVINPANVYVKDSAGVVCDSSQVVGTGYKLALIQHNVTNKVLAAVVKGDVNGDGFVKASDYILIKAYLKGSTSLKGAYLKAGDIDDDNRLSSTDYMKIKRHIENLYQLHTPLSSVKPETMPAPTANTNVLGDSVEYANQVKNQVNTYYKDNQRTSVVYENATMKLTHGLVGEGEKQVQEFANKDGGVYFTDSFAAYLQVGDKITYLNQGNDIATGEDTPVPRFGYYYYENQLRNIRFFTYSALRACLVFNTLPDSLRINQRLYIDKNINSDNDYVYGNELKIAVDTVNKLEIKDANGTYNSVGNYDSSTVEYIALDIKGAGVMGLIYATDSLYENTTITVENNHYVIKNTFTVPSLEAGNIYNVALQLYNDTTHDFTGVREAAYLERNPISITTGTFDVLKIKNSPYYDSTTGLYKIPATLPAASNKYLFEELHAYAHVTAENDQHQRPVYLQFSTNGNADMSSGVVRDENGNIVAIPVEFCRNFSGDDPVYEKDTSYGEIIYPLYMKANEKITTIPTHIWNNWGKLSFVQFSSIRYKFMYALTSKNPSETTCFTPSGAGGYGGNIVADFRGVSGDRWPGTNPQYNHGGNFYFTNENNIRFNSKYEGQRVLSAGPGYVEVEFDYIAESENYKYTVNHKQFPSDDETRNYYSIEIEFLKSVSYTNATQNFQLLQYYTSMGDYTKMAYIDSEGNISSRTPVYRVFPLKADGSFFTFYTNTSGDTENMAMLVKDYSVTMSGKKLDTSLAINVFGKRAAALVINEKQLSFKPGDKVTVDVVLVPYGNSLQTHYDNALRLYEDCILNPLTATVTKGTLMKDAFMPKIYADNNSAEFSVEGGRNNITVRIDGFSSDKVPVIEEYTDGQWIPYQIASEKGYDGYSIYYNADNTYGFGFVIDMGNEGNRRTFRVNR